MSLGWRLPGLVLALGVGLASWWWAAHRSNPPFLPPRDLVVEPPLPARSVLFKEIDEFAAEVRELEAWLDGVANLLGITDP
jgi:hypothetical protein